MLRRIAIAVLVAGCGAAPASVAPSISLATSEPARAPDPTPEDASPPAGPEPRAEPEPAAPRARFSIPEDGALPELARLPVRTVSSRGCAWDEVALPDPLARRRLSMLVEDLAYEHGQTGWSESEPLEGDEGCRAVLATARVVSIRCRPRALMRDGDARYTHDYADAHFVIDGAEVRPFDPLEAFVAGTRPEALMDTRGCVDRLAPTMSPAYGGPADRRAAARRSCRALDTARALLDARGVLLILNRDDAVHVPYAELRAHLADTGPLAWIFAEVDRAPAPPLEEASGWAVSEIAPVAELASRWSALPEEMARQVRWARVERSAGELVVDRAVGHERAEEVSRAVGAAARPTRWTEEPFAFRAVVTRAAIALLARPARHHSSMRLRWLPEGAQAVVLSPPFEDAEHPAQVQLAAAPLARGWARADDLAPREGCGPSPEPFLASLPEADREPARERLVVAAVTLHGGGARPAALFSTRVESRSYVALHARDGCTTGAAIRRVDLSGFVFDARLTTTEAGGGRSLLVLGLLRGQRDRRYSVRDVTSGRSVLEVPIGPLAQGYVDVENDFEEGLPNVAALAEGERYWPLVITGVNVDTTRFRWNGRRLVEDAPE